MNLTKFRRFLLLIIILNCVLLFAGCDSTWTGQASNIIGMLMPAISAAIMIAGTFLGVPPNLLAALQAWASQAQDALLNVVKPAIDAYNDAIPAGKAELLQRIKGALDSVVTNLRIAMQDLHVDNPDHQAKLAAFLGLIENQLVALINLIPVLEGKVTDAHAAHAAVHAVKPAKVFKEEFNTMAAEYGPKYQIQ